METSICHVSNDSQSIKQRRSAAARLIVAIAGTAAALRWTPLGFTGSSLLRSSRLQHKAIDDGATQTDTGSSLSYKDAEYWERRYSTGDKGANEDKIDDRGVGWLCAYEGPVQETLQAVTRGDRGKVLLNIGCGVDRFSEDVYADGYTNLLSSDISQTAISEMASKTAATMPMAKWFVDDALQMSVPSQSVDVVLDKGTLDAILIRADPFATAARMLREVQRVLKVGGVYMLLTHGRGDPDSWRLPLLAMPHLSMNVAKTPDLGGYFIFVCTKLEEPDASAEAVNWAQAQAWADEQDRQDLELEMNAIDEVGQ